MNLRTTETAPRTLKAFGRAAIIGLGGTGQKALLEIKRNFQNHCDGKIPPSIRLLALDTDQPEKVGCDVHGKPVEFTSSEFCHLQVEVVREAIRNKHVQEWWISYPPINNTSITKGAGGIREMGRLALFNCIPQVKSRIETMYVDMNAFDSKDKMEAAGFSLLDSSRQVIVIGSLAGGTGSGLMFDISVLCRALGGNTFSYMAYLMMPWVYHNIANSAYENTFGALSELNHLATLSAENPLRIKYSDTFECRLEESPYHIVNLVDGQCDNGERIPDSKSLSTFIAESVYHLTGALGRHASAVYDNIITLKNGLNETDWDGAKALYSAIGVSSLRYPAKEVHRGVSCDLTADLLELLAGELTQMPATNLPTEDHGNAFLQQNQLEPTNESIVASLLPHGSIETLSADDDLLETIETRQQFVADLDEDAKRGMDKGKQTIRKNLEQATARLTPKLKQFLQNEPDSGGIAAESLARSFESAKLALTGLGKSMEEKIKDAQEMRNRTESQIPSGKNLFTNLLGAFPKKAAAYADATNAHIEAELGATAIRAAMELIDDLTAALREYLQVTGQAQSEAETLQARIHSHILQLRSQAAAMHLSKLTRKKFEYVLGLDDVRMEDRSKISYTYFIDKTNPVPTLDNLRKMLNQRSDLLPKAGIKNPREYVAALYDFVAAECAGPILGVAVLDVLRTKREKAEASGQEDPTVKLFQRLIEDKATLLLSLKKAKLTDNSRSIREFLVIGVGEPSGGDNAPQDRGEEFLSKWVPEHLHDSANISFTEDPYRITVTHYKAIFPLHVVSGIEDLRRAYNDRVLPPSHIDRRMLFEIKDPLPDEPKHQVSLKLLCLALMNCFGLLKHEEDGGGHFYDPAPCLEKYCFDKYDRRDFLPGKRGKFYSLVEELASDYCDRLRAGIQTELERIALEPGFLDEFFEEAKECERIFRAKVALVAKGHSKEVSVPTGKEDSSSGQQEETIRLFNKMVTGRYYQREADFLRKIEKSREKLIVELEKKGTTLLKLLLSSDKGFHI